MTVSDIVRKRLQNEHLVGNLFETPEDVVKWFGAVQSQDYSGAKWAIAQRVKRATSESIDKVFNEGRILRTHVMRPTWHFVHPSDIRWLLELTAPRVKKIMASYLRKEELDDALLKRCNELFTKALQGGHQLTRAELGSVLKEHGIKLSGMRLGFIVGNAELDMVMCSGALREKQQTYALFDERVSGSAHFDREEALAKLTKRYFTSHGPALVQDCAWWSGLTVADINTGIELAKSDLMSEESNGKTYWSGTSQISTKIKEPTVHLLPNYDEYLISYKDYSPVQDPAFTKQYADNLMFYRHIIVSNGLVIGGWKRTFEKKTVFIKLTCLREFTKEERQSVEQEVEKFGKFVDMPVLIKD